MRRKKKEIYLKKTLSQAPITPRIEANRIKGTVLQGKTLKVQNT